MRHRRERRDREGRHLLPADRQEAPARPGGRLENRLPASTWWTPAVRSCRCRPRSSPTATTSAASSSTRRACPPLGIPQIAVGDGLVHRRRRLRPGDERRDGHRPGHRDDLPRRPAAGEGRDGRGGDRRGARRRRRPHAPLGRRRPLRRLDDEHALAIAREIVRQPRPAGARRRPGTPAPPEPPAPTPRTSTGSSRATSATRSTCAR